MEKNKEQAKNIWKPLCLVMAALLALSWVFFGFLYSKGNVSFSTLENPEQNYSAGGGAVIGEVDECGISLMAVKVPLLQSSTLDPAENVEYETVYSLTATVTPDEAADKTVDWSVAFVNPDSEWASGKTVTDYVTVTPTSDGALTAKAECLQAFGESIVVTVSMRNDSSVSGSCKVEYVKKVIGLDVSVTDYDGSPVTSFDILRQAQSYIFTPVLVYGVGTVGYDSSDIYLTITYDRTLLNFMKEAGVSTFTLDVGSVKKEKIDGSYSYSIGYNRVKSMYGVKTDSINLFYEKLAEWDGDLFSISFFVECYIFDNGALEEQIGEFYTDESVAHYAMTYFFHFGIGSIDVGVSASNVTVDTPASVF